jgi:Protein of unknown function VcgC/VcgE (DUF2780)
MNRAVCWVLIVAAFVAPGSALAPALAGEASSELTNLLAKELGSTTKQAQGAAGSLFRLAKTRMTPENFSKVASAVPGMDELLAAAPALDAKAAGAGALGQVMGKEGVGDLAGVAQSFRKLGLKAVPVLTDYIGKTSGGDLAKLLGESLR